MANDPNPQVQKRLDQIEKLQVEVDTVKAESEEWKKNMDRLSSEKQTARKQLASTEVQLRAAEEKILVEAKKIEELQSQLSSAVSGQENLARELEAAKSEFKVDVEAIQEQAKNMVKHARWEARREALERVHAQNFDILAEIENAKICEARAQKLAYPQEDSEGLSESKGGEDPEGEDVASDGDHAT
ncbi:uncharacterized protein [Nicotiana tomentosiformis]|uniref:uncharacterized protein n=1 Tax=Nicotiana tomentosiformis TaxID=4098 RepID=UPI00388C714B